MRSNSDTSQRNFAFFQLVLLSLSLHLSPVSFYVQQFWLLFFKNQCVYILVCSSVSQQINILRDECEVWWKRGMDKMMILSNPRVLCRIICPWHDMTAQAQQAANFQWNIDYPNKNMVMEIHFSMCQVNGGLHQVPPLSLWFLSVAFHLLFCNLLKKGIAAVALCHLCRSLLDKWV